jgi:putative addiction module component (TIGR02574 family)
MHDYHKLSVDERIVLIEKIENSIDADRKVYEEAPLPQWQKMELDRRLAERAKNPKEGVSWREVMRRLRTAKEGQDE